MKPTVCVCICTFKRPQLLRRTLDALAEQQTCDRLAYSVVVVDNDSSESGRQTVEERRNVRKMAVAYCVEPEQNIALARNRALSLASADYIAFIDDDEFPCVDWLVTMLKAVEHYGVAGVLGPVRPHFDEAPPAWLVRGGFCSRPEHDTGQLLDWKQTRTGNVLFRQSILRRDETPFRREFGNGGEDQDFFRRMMKLGHSFVWCNEGVVFEVVPAERRTRRYLLKRALLRGQNERLLLSASSLGKSVIAAALYASTLPIMLLLGHHLFMKQVIRLCDHLGKLMVAVGVKPIRGQYLSGG